MTFGKTTVLSLGNFEATRNGDRLHIRGTVAHGFPASENFDFHAGQPGASQAGLLEDSGEVAPFRMSYDRRQDVEAVSEYEPDGRLMLLRSTWGAVR